MTPRRDDAWLTDEEILRHYRVRYPYILLATAKELHRMNLRYRHLATAARKKEKQDKERERERLREKLFGARGDDG